ncbi:MAG: hypothetical protein Q9162_001673 [Coniocarpon cinnabarinum]
MNPFQKNKVDISSLSPEEQDLFRKYGKLPNRTDVLQNKLKERKYFDSGDYALSKAGKASDIGVTQVGREHPNPETIPHLSPTTSNGGEQPGPTSGSSYPGGQRNSISAPSGALSDGIRLPPAMQQGTLKSGSPVKEGSLMQRSVSVDDQEDEDGGSAVPGGAASRAGKLGTGLTEEERKVAGAVSPPPQREGVPIRGGQ